MRKTTIPVLILSLIMILTTSAVAFAASGQAASNSRDATDIRIAAGSQDTTDIRIAAGSQDTTDIRIAAGSQDATDDQTTTGSQSAAGDQNTSTSQNSKYKYKIIIYSGMQGHFKSGNTSHGGTVWSKEYAPGERVEIYLKDTLGFVLDNDKYYVRGLRVTGHDNDENTGIQSLNFTADRDVSYEIAYGIRGSLVSYIVEYVDEDGKEIHESDVYYGMPGDKPVVSYRYVPGYKPMMYTINGVLSEDESKNVFTFVYRELTEEDYHTRTSTDGGTVVLDTEVTEEEEELDEDEEEEEEEEVDEVDDVRKKENSGSQQSLGSTITEAVKEFFDMQDGPIPKAARFVKENPAAGTAIFAAFAVLLFFIIFFIRRRKKKKKQG